MTNDPAESSKPDTSADWPIAEQPDALGVLAATVKRDWTTAKAWLKRELTDAAPE
ncbi:MAG: hypothetical protein R2832_15005 [Rhodothermales bacterium]